MRGMYATSDIKNLERILFVPDHLIVTLDMALESPLGKLMDEKKLTPGGYRLNAPTTVLLAVYNLQEERKGEEALLHRHFALLPGIEESPVVFTDDEKHYLKGSPFLDMVETEIISIKYDYDLIAKEIPEFGE